MRAGHDGPALPAERGHDLSQTNEFAELFIRLDMALTGKERTQAERTASHSRHVLTDPITYVTSNEREYYLSDGGYSRIVANDEGKVWVTSNSLQRVKDAWNTPEAQELASLIGKAITDAVAEYEASHCSGHNP